MKSSITIQKNPPGLSSAIQVHSHLLSTLPAPHIQENCLHRAISHILYLLQCHLVKSSFCPLCSQPRTTHTKPNPALDAHFCTSHSKSWSFLSSVSGLCDQYLVTIFSDKLPGEQKQEYCVPPTHFLPSPLEIIFKPVVWLQPNLANK